MDISLDISNTIRVFRDFSHMPPPERAYDVKHGLALIMCTKKLDDDYDR